MAVGIAEQERDRFLESEQPMDIETIKIDTAGLSTIAQTILDALEEYEDELEILSRHELILTSPGPPDVIETQRQFDAYRGTYVIVETEDPFNSNRTLKGTLVDRNSMDVMINKQGRLVTIPLNFVKCVRLPKQKNIQS
jgi:ribosome maturation factor RimP